MSQMVSTLLISRYTNWANQEEGSRAQFLAEESYLGTGSDKEGDQWQHLPQNGNDVKKTKVFITPLSKLTSLESHSTSSAQAVITLVIVVILPKYQDKT